MTARREVPAAVFLDRDGTIIQDRHFLADPEGVVILDGAGEAIRRLNERGVAVIVVTNQSGIARGHFTHADYARVQERMMRLLGERGARIDASYYCPHHPDHDRECDCRKPAAGMFRRAAHEHGIDISRTVFIGDRWRDVAAADDLGGSRILIRSDRTTDADIALAHERGVPVLGSLREGVDLLLGRG